MDKYDDKTKVAIFRRKIRCNMCYEIPIIKEILQTDGSCLITAECLNRHGVFFCPIEDFCSDKTQLDNIKCNNCNKIQNVVDAYSKLFYFCKNCNKFICPSCFKTHNSKFKKTHQIHRIDSLDYTCKEHNGPYTAYCEKCNLNLCPLCLQRVHFNHEGVRYFEKVKPNEGEYAEEKSKLSNQKELVDSICENLDKFLKLVNDKVGGYKNNLKNLLKFNYQVFNCFKEDTINYQSIVNFKKILDINIDDVGFIKEIQDELDKLIKLIGSKSSNKNLPPPKLISTPKLDKELLETVLKANETTKGQTMTANEMLEFQKNREKEEFDDFSDNELLEKFSFKNKKLLKKEEIIGEVEKIYSIEEFGSYAMIIDNGLFLYDRKTYDLLSYIDINKDSIEIKKINMFTYYYNNKKNILYLFIVSNDNKINIYTIDENDDYNHKLIQEIEIKDLFGLYCNANEELLILDKNGISIYTNKDDKFTKEKDIENKDNDNLQKLYETKNFLLFSIEGKNTILFYDKIKFEKIFSVDGIENDENRKIFEISDNYLCISFKNRIKMVNIQEKKVCYSYENINTDHVECVEAFGNKKILLSCSLSEKEENKLIFTIIEWDEMNKVFLEKEKLEDLDCKIICKIDNQKAITYTKYGVNLIEVAI